MRSSSAIQPNPIDPDYGSLHEGKMDLLIHWEIVETDGIWEYQEERIRVTVPSSEIPAYINANTDRFFRMVGVSAPSDEQWKSDIELALLDLAGV